MHKLFTGLKFSVKIKKFKILLLLALLISGKSFSQDQLHAAIQKNANKGKLYIFWGWNRGYYTKSDIHFTGTYYDFTLQNVIAKDRQTPFDMDIYFAPTRMSIPQTNFRIGYFFKDNFNISLGVDHMKYVVQQNQTVKISGSIAQSGTQYDGIYDDNNIVIQKGFLGYEHTDGLNYVNGEFSQFDVLFKYRNIVELAVTEGAGVGFMLPKTNVTLMNNNRNDEFHLAGFGTDVKLGLNLTLLKYFFLQSELKGGYINMPDIRTTEFKEDRASQHFFFLQTNFLFGLIFPII